METLNSLKFLFLGNSNEGNLNDCKFERPMGLEVVGDSLLIVDIGKIKRITCAGKKPQA